jgi:lipopolysaccharide export system permease protein
LNVLTIIDRYVLRQVIAPLTAAFSIGLLMLLAERMVRLLDTTLGKRNSFGVVFELLAYLVPHYLGTAIPGALFIGLLFGFNKLSKNQEMDAMSAMGFGLHRLARPTIILALLFSALSFAIFGWMQPYTRFFYRAAVFDVKNIDAFYLAEEGVFMQADNRTFILGELKRSDNSFKKIFILENKGKDGLDVLTARDGRLVPVEGQLRPVLRLSDGHRLETGRPFAKENLATTSSSFSLFDTPLGKISKDLFRARGNDERELTFPELYSSLDAPPKGSTSFSMRAELHRRIVNVVVMLILPILALPFAVGRPRTPRAYRIGIAFLILLAFNEIVEQGALATRENGISPLLTLWLPTLLLAIYSFWRFYRASFVVGGDEGGKLSERIAKIFASVWSRLIWFLGKRERT